MSDSFDPDNLAAGTHIGLYRVIRRVGAGGFGTLFEVQRDGKGYALKLARERLGAKTAAERARFQSRSDREVAALKSLDHPNIVKVHALDRWPDLETGHPYIVMDLVRGAELREWSRSRAPSALAVVALFEKLARALDHMHLAGVVHRDLKSENVLVREDGEPILIDFGIARARSSPRLTQHVALVGTPSHYAPEYLRHRQTDAWARGEEFEWTPATDLYAVGYMLYEVLAGCPPFDVDDDDDLRLWKAIQDEEPPRPSQRNAAVPPALDAVVMRLLAKDPRERHASAQELADELRELAEAHQRDPAWNAPVAVPEQSDAGAHGEPGGHTSQLERIDDLAAQGAEMAARAGIAAATHDSSAEATPTTVSAMDEGAPAGLDPQALRALREKAEAVARPRRRTSLLLFIAGTAVLAIAAVVLAASRSRPQQPTSLMAHAARAPLPAPTSTPTAAPAASPEASVRAGPSAADARAIDRELEARYGGRPTVTPEGRIVNLTGPTHGTAKPTAATDDAANAPVSASNKAAPEVAGRGIAPPSDEPAWLKRTARPMPTATPAAETKSLGIATGSRIAARLVTALDSRTVGSGPVEARITRPFLVRGEIAIPSGTLVFGRASAIDGRFIVRFDRMRLTDDREIEFVALAMHRDDHRPGLPATRRIVGERRQEQENLGAAVARSGAGTILNTVTGGLGQDLVRDAGQLALQRRDTGSSASTDTLVLEPGLIFDVWVERPF